MKRPFDSQWSVQLHVPVKILKIVAQTSLFLRKLAVAWATATLARMVECAQIDFQSEKSNIRLNILVSCCTLLYAKHDKESAGFRE